ncbi:hypothetical protein SC614_00200 [Legionella pneumophila serogroup 1]
MLKTLGGATRTAARDTTQVTATTMVALGGMYFWDRVAKNYGLYDKENSKQINLDLANDNYMRPKA